MELFGQVICRSLGKYLEFLDLFFHDMVCLGQTIPLVREYRNKLIGEGHHFGKKCQYNPLSIKYLR